VEELEEECYLLAVENERLKVCYKRVLDPVDVARLLMERTDSCALAGVRSVGRHW
jgi:hypothetical protein